MAEPVPDVCSKVDCLRLLRRVRVGRLAFTARALPVVRPVYFSVGGDDVVVRTSAGSGLADEVTGSVVALQADQVDPAGGGGWSVTVTGRAAAQDDRELRRRLLELAPCRRSAATTSSWSCHLDCSTSGDARCDSVGNGSDLRTEGASGAVHVLRPAGRGRLHLERAADLLGAGVEVAQSPASQATR